MRETKKEKGITLITLMVTVVILLILASVTISSMQNDGIIDKAQSAENKVEKAEEKKENMLKEYIDYLVNGTITGNYIVTNSILTNNMITNNVIY